VRVLLKLLACIVLHPLPALACRALDLGLEILRASIEVEVDMTAYFRMNSRLHTTPT